MTYPVIIQRLSNRTRGYDAKHIEACVRAIARGKEALKISRPVDTFIGRKTQEPFPKEQERFLKKDDE
jgi:hypothetical protein